MIRESLAGARSTKVDLRHARLAFSPFPFPFPFPFPLGARMPFDHERLDVYRLGLDFLVLADDVVEHLPRGRGHLADQLSRAATSIVLNIAEGAGKFSKPDKRRYYLTAIGSATESAAILDVCARLVLVTPERQAEGKAMLERIASMLIKLAKNLEDASYVGNGNGNGNGREPPPRSGGFVQHVRPSIEGATGTRSRWARA